MPRAYALRCVLCLSDPCLCEITDPVGIEPILLPWTCAECGRELCAELDSYYGRDPWGKEYCARCRKMKGIK